VESFSGWWKSVADETRSGRPSTVTRVESNKQIDQRIRDNQRIRASKFASEMKNSLGERL
jgi:hypothetical protein